jgi:hypothetical protein
MKNHVSEDVRQQFLADIPIQEMAQRAAEEGGSLLDYLSVIRSILLQQFQLAAGAEDRYGVAILGGKLTDVCKEVGKITGELMRSAPPTTINNTLIMQSPLFADLQRMLLTKLKGHPKALASVVEGLRELESRAIPEDTASLPPMMIEARTNGGADARQ